MISANSVEAIVHNCECVYSAFSVHVLFPGPHVHHRVIAVQPGHVLAIMDSTCTSETRTYKSEIKSFFFTDIDRYANDCEVGGA